MYPQLQDMSECWKHIKDTTSTHTRTHVHTQREIFPAEFVFSFWPLTLEYKWFQSHGLKIIAPIHKTMTVLLIMIVNKARFNLKNKQTDSYYYIFHRILYKY